ncbi:GRAM domain-containing protein 2B-like isoform X3 [Toxotes jaculatrix]|nr:GRAM domain-containing protein 2B-like isoform X2 [Toxotes jaculatrix]XP_040911403.1 GRAM domain-containing protein 2B-like isoform X3 [Toxotes jaculatrix]
MSLKGRRFSLDSAVYLDGAGVLSHRRGSVKFISKKSKQSQSLDEARVEIQEFNHSLNSNVSVREQTIAEESPERSHELTNNHSFLKHNKSFHKLFPEIPEGENLTHTFTCALQKEVLYHGKLFVSESHVCFHSSVLLKDTKVVIPTSSVSEVKKHNSALSMLSIQTADGEKHSFVSLRNRETCYKLLQNICSHVQQGESPSSSPHLSSAENEAEHDVPSSYSSLEDSIDHDVSRQDSRCPSSEGATRCSSTRQSSLTDEDDREAASWIWRVFEKFTPFFFLSEIRNLSILFYIYMMLIVLLLLTSGYIGLRITALEEQLNSLGALTETSLHHKE